MRFNIRIDPIWRWALLLGGATSQNSYVMLGDDGMHFRFGLLFNRTVPYDQVVGVYARSWPLLPGIGWRSDLRGVLGLTGSYHDVVEVKLKKRIGNWAGVFPVDRIAVSLEEPEAFIGELSERAGLVEGTADSGQPTAGSKQTAAGTRRRAARAPTKKASPAAKGNGAKPTARKPAAGRTPARARRARRA